MTSLISVRNKLNKINQLYENYSILIDSSLEIPVSTSLTKHHLIPQHCEKIPNLTTKWTIEWLIIKRKKLHHSKNFKVKENNLFINSSSFLYLTKMEHELLHKYLDAKRFALYFENDIHDFFEENFLLDDLTFLGFYPNERIIDNKKKKKKKESKATNEKTIKNKNSNKKRTFLDEHFLTKTEIKTIINKYLEEIKVNPSNKEKLNKEIRKFLIGNGRNLKQYYIDKAEKISGIDFLNLIKDNFKEISESYNPLYSEVFTEENYYKEINKTLIIVDKNNKIIFGHEYFAFLLKKEFLIISGANVLIDKIEFNVLYSKKISLEDISLIAEKKDK